MNIAKAAAEWAVDEATYKSWEAGDAPAPEVRLGGLDPHEHFLVLRRRAGLSVKELADLLGVGMLALLAMEDGRRPLDRLEEFWSGR